MNELVPVNQPAITVEEIARKTTVLAQQLNYEGDLSPIALEDGVRFYQKRTIEDLFEMGKCLLLLKEQTPHGEFIKRLDSLSLGERTVRKIMSATLKFSNRNTSAVLQAVDSQSKLLELITLDDDEIDLIEQGGSIGDVSLDSIDKMSVRELKQALRAAKADGEAKDQIIRKKDENLNKMDSQLSVLNSPMEIKLREQSARQQLEQEATKTLQSASLTLINAVMRFQNEVASVQDIANENNIFTLNQRVDESVQASLQRIAQLSTDFGVPVNFEEMVTPTWLFGQDSQQIEEPEVVYGLKDVKVEG